MSQPKSYRRVVRHVTTGFAAILVFLALILPDQITRLPPGNHWQTALLRIPIEALLAGAVLLLLPIRWRRWTAATLGLVLGALTVIKLVDIGFYAILARRFDPVLDWTLFDDGFNFLIDSAGRPSATAVAIGALLGAVLLIAGMTWAMLRLTVVAAGNRRLAWPGLGVAGVAWVALFLTGYQLIGGIPVASTAAADLARDTALALPKDLADKRKFLAEAQDDAYRDRPGDQLLTALRGKDVVVSFVESYGRDAVENPAFNGAVLTSLADGDKKLAAAGFAARSGFLTSSTAGGGSWLAHSTFLSGMWVNNESRYRSLVATDRLTLTRAFKNTGHRTVGMEPGVIFAWPEGSFYGYDQVYDKQAFNYHGPQLSWSPMPDQFVMSQFQKQEYAKPNRGPLLAEITLTSSHTPWAPVPSMLDWDQLGDGSVYGPMVKSAATPKEVWKDDARIRTEYARSIAYSVDSLIGWAAKYGDDNLVMVFLGDHQPASVVVGQTASHDVPITIVAKDPKVFDRIASWGWTSSVKPAADAPVWRMDTFRDRFLTAFGPEGDPH
ncbi:sulfatase-like hydrolase/transferase [Actinoplanes awajinensis]|uniref:Sulfatase n=1 Tax=Actinoplanes awajinensis subsp. mycoplanecinus TaxID=135947 RepID=A0A0X3VDG0_9ACTN|nr:sulfatase-like hydrolase/transferase [Actinoplanes awajinensis]KUL42302.1 sulfatase [Actinoplanes awajinensis subsp. mycoplanecinus]